MLKHIVIINDYSFINGGVGKVAISSAIQLSKLGYEVTIFTAVQPTDEELKHSTVKIVCLNQYDILNNPSRLSAIIQGVWNRKAKLEFEKLLSTLDANSTIVHYHGWMKALSPSLFAVTAKLGFKSVVTTHDYFTACPNGGFFDYQKRKICHRKPISLSCICCNCDSRSYFQKIWRCLRQVAQNHYQRKNKQITLFTISELTEKVLSPFWNGITSNIVLVKNPTDFPEKRDYDEEKEFYLFMARLSPEKGVSLFASAVSDMKVKACVLGNGYLEGELKSNFPNVVFPGWANAEKKSEWLQKTKFFVMSSLWYEGAPLTIIEVQSLGIPCIVPDECAASEQIIDGVNGFIFKTGNLESLKDAIKRAEAADYFVLCENVKKLYVKEQHTIDTHVKRLIEEYSKILEN